MRSLILIFAAGVLLAPSLASAQYHAGPPRGPRLIPYVKPELQDPSTRFKFSWSMGLPLFETHDYISDFSLKGFTFELNYRISPNVSIGGWSAWQGFDTKKGGTQTFGNVTVTGVLLRNQQYIPFVAHADYHLQLDNKETELYFGGGMGGYYVETLQEVGVLFTQYDETFHFGLSPEVGAITGFGGNTYVFGEVRWNFLFGSGPLSAQSYLNFNVGLLFL